MEIIWSIFLEHFMKNDKSMYRTILGKKVLFYIRAGPSSVGGPGGPKTPHFLPGKKGKQGKFCRIIWIAQQNINLDPPVSKCRRGPCTF